MATCDVENTIRSVLSKSHINELKKEQRQILDNLPRREDCMVVLLTGYGKSLPYQIFAPIYHTLWDEKGRFGVLSYHGGDGRSGATDTKHSRFIRWIYRWVILNHPTYIFEINNKDPDWLSTEHLLYVHRKHMHCYLLLRCKKKTILTISRYC